MYKWIAFVWNGQLQHRLSGRCLRILEDGSVDAKGESDDPLTHLKALKPSLPPVEASSKTQIEEEVGASQDEDEEDLVGSKAPIEVDILHDEESETPFKGSDPYPESSPVFVFQSVESRKHVLQVCG